MKAPLALAVVFGLASPAAGIQHEPPPRKLDQPFAVYVMVGEATAPRGAKEAREVADSVSDLQEQISKKQKDWVRLVENIGDAEVLIEVKGRGVDPAKGHVLEGRMSVFDVFEGPIMGQGGLDPGGFSVKLWRQAAEDMSGRLVSFLKETHHLVSPVRTTAARPAAMAATRRGDALKAKGDTEAALTAYDEALRLAPKYAPALRQRGGAFLAKGLYDKAIADLSLAIAADPDHVGAYFGRAIAHAGMGHEEDAQSDRRAGLERVPPLPRTPPSGAQGSRTAAELEARKAEIEMLRGEIEKQKVILGPEALARKRTAVDDKVREKDALAAAVLTCEAGDKAICDALEERLKTGTARLVEAAKDPADPGVDTARVKAASATLRKTPEAKGVVVRRLSNGTLVALLEREPTSGWYHVIHVDTAEEGWIPADVLDVKLTKTTKKASPFLAKQVDTQSPPKVTVINDSDVDMTLTVGGGRHVIAKRSQLSIAMAAGRHPYVGAAPGVIPAMGTQALEIGHEYTWRFWIVTERRKN